MLGAGVGMSSVVWMRRVSWVSGWRRARIVLGMDIFGRLLSGLGVSDSK